MYFPQTARATTCEWDGYVFYHRMAHLRAYTVFLTAEPRRGSLLADFIRNFYG